MADEVFLYILVFVKEIVGAAECYLVDIFVDFLLRHADSMIADDKFAFFDLHLYGEVAKLTLKLASRSKGFHFLSGVDGIGNQLAKENFMVGIEKLFDYREDVLGLYIQITVHCVIYLLFFSCVMPLNIKP